MPPSPRRLGALCGALLIATTAPSLLVHGQSAGAPILLTPNAAGTATANRGSGESYQGRPGLSGTGRFTVFVSSASDLVAGDTNGTIADVFVRDRVASTTTLVSVTPGGTSGNAESTWPTIAAGGTLVVFESDATDLVAGDTNQRPDVFVRDLLAGATERVSVSTAGTQANGSSGLGQDLAISDDGRYVAFISDASNLVSASIDTNNRNDVFVRDRVLNTTRLITMNTANTAAASFPVNAPLGHLRDLTMSRDGRYVAFSSRATDLVPNDTNQSTDLFLRDLVTNTTIRLCVNPTTSSTTTTYEWVSFSDDARFVVFGCNASNMGPSDTNGALDVFRRDLLLGDVAAVSVRGDGLAMASGQSSWGSVSADGRYVAFWSNASNIVSGTSGSHVYVRDMLQGQTVLVDALPNGATPFQGASLWRDAMSDDGRYIVFSSSAALAPGAVADLGEAYVRDRVAGTTTLLSANVTGGSTAAFPNNLGAVTNAMSREGNVALFESHRTLHSALPDANEQVDLFAFAVTPGTPGSGSPLLTVAISNQGATASPGGKIAYLVTYGNAGTGPSTGSTVRIAVPALTRWSAIESTPGWQCSPDPEAGSACTFAVGPLAAGAQGTATFVVYVDEDARAASTGTAALHGVAGALAGDVNATATHGGSASSSTGWVACGLALGQDACCIASALAAGGQGDLLTGTRMGDQLTAIGLDQLYDVRDRILRPTPNGQHYADLYYAHKNAVRDTILGSTTLRTRAVAIIDDWMPGFDALVSGQGDSVVVTSQRVATLVTFLQDVANAAPTSLKAVILDELTRFPANELAGMTMAQAARRLGVHDGGQYRRYFAEGATGTFFTTIVALSNTAASAVDATLRFLTKTGQTIQRVVSVPAHGQASLDVGTVAGLGAAEFSTVVESATPITVDRTLSWDATGYGSHTESSLAAPSLTWYLAEGATHSGFDLFYLLQNPDPVRTASVTVRYLTPSGAPVSKSYVIGAASRENIWVNQEEFDVQGVPTRVLAATDVSATFDVTNGVPIIVERALYRSTPTLTFGAGHESAGVTAPATQWFLAEGATGDYFDLFVLVANPTTQQAQIRARYLLPSGQVLTKDHLVAPNSRFNIWVDQEELPAGSGQYPLADTAVSTTIESLNGVPVIVERAMWWPGTAATWYEAHNSPGATASGYVWAVADGEVGGSAAAETYVLIANVSATAGQAKVTLLFDDGTTAVKYFVLPANSRNNVSVKDEFPTAARRRFGALVESVGAPRAQIVVERAVYGNANGEVWTAGSNALATRVR